MGQIKNCLLMVRGGEIKLRVPAAQIVIRADGTLWAKSGNPLLGIADPSEKDRCVKLIKAGKFDQIPAEYFVRLGDNPNGIWAGDVDAWEAHPAKKASDDAAEAARAARAEIERRTKRIYLSSRGWGDYSPVEWIGDVTRPADEILTECKALLAKGYDVDQPDQSDEELMGKIAAAQKAYTNPPAPMPEPKHGPGYCYNCETYCFGDCGNYAPMPTHETEMRKVNEMIREANYGISEEA